MVDSPRLSGTGTVVLVDDHPSYAQGLKVLIESLADDIEVVGVATDAPSGVALVEQHSPDVALLDVHMPNREGIEAAKRIRLLRPQVKVAMLTVSEEPGDIRDCIRAGVSGYLSKQIDTLELVSSVRMILKGEVVFGSFVMSSLSKDTDDASRLHDRELMLLRLLAHGLDRSAIAREMALSESSLKRAMRDIEKKLGVQNRIQAVAVAAKRGLI